MMYQMDFSRWDKSGDTIILGKISSIVAEKELLENKVWEKWALMTNPNAHMLQKHELL
jgi:hypothetical protein